MAKKDLLSLLETKKGFREWVESTDFTHALSDGMPSAADLDKVAEENQIKKATE